MGVKKPAQAGLIEAMAGRLAPTRVTLGREPAQEHLQQRCERPQTNFYLYYFGRQLKHGIGLI